jgi:hypothetical protein
MSDQKTLKRFDDAIVLMKKYCAGPLPQDPFAAPSWLMGGAHALILTALQNVYVVSNHKPTSLISSAWWLEIIPVLIHSFPESINYKAG